MNEKRRTTDEIQIESEAKVNLFLAVKGARPDGFHELETIYQAIDITDMLTFSQREPGIEITTDWPGLSTGADNLCYKAAALLLEKTLTQNGAAIELHKHIPPGAGLAGGSSNAAATLLALNELWGLNLPDEKLLEYSAALGSDVTFFLRGGTALATGRGEIITPLPTPTLWFVIIWPGISQPTSAVYRTWDAEPVQGETAIEDMLVAINTNDIEGIAKCLRNDLEGAAMKLCPACIELKQSLLDAGSLGALVSGSGSSLFGLARDRDHALAIAAKVAEHYDGWLRIARSLAVT